LRKNISTTIHQAKHDFPACDLVYANWVDGTESFGLLCEQDLLQKKTSTFIDKNMLVLEKRDNMIFGSYEELMQQKNLDIILDTIHMKVYIMGERVTSKELHSQTGTIEMLLTALKHQ
jgi:hypothetical protein